MCGHGFATVQGARSIWLSVRTSKFGMQSLVKRTNRLISSEVVQPVPQKIKVEDGFLGKKSRPIFSSDTRPPLVFRVRVRECCGFHGSRASRGPSRSSLGGAGSGPSKAHESLVEVIIHQRPKEPAPRVLEPGNWIPAPTGMSGDRHKHSAARSAAQRQHFRFSTFPTKVNRVCELTDSTLDIDLS
jgi:hypothetical protein